MNDTQVDTNWVINYVKFIPRKTINKKEKKFYSNK